MDSTNNLRALPKPNSVDVLFVCYGGGHIQAIAPVALTLQEQGYNICVFAITTAIAVCQNRELPYFTYADLPQASDEDVQREGARMAAAYPLNGPIPFEETRAYLGINFKDLVQQHGLEEANLIYGSGGRQKFFPINHMTYCLQYLRPKMLIATNSPRSEFAALKAAGNLGIPSICIVDLFALQEISWLKTPGLGTKVCVLNQGVKDMFVREGRPNDEIEITGNPAFDRIYDPAVIQSGFDLRKARGWGEGRFTILYATSTEPSFHPFTGEVGDKLLPRRIEERLRNILHFHSDLELVVRRHPSEPQEVKPGERIYASSQKTEDINELIHAVDIVVVTSSTVGLQAYLAGVPVVAIECSIMSKDTPLADFNMARSVPSLDALEEVLVDEIKLLKGVQQKKAKLEMHDYPNATSSISEQAMQILRLSACY